MTPASTIDFVASANSHETSPSIMKAITLWADNTDDAERIWEDGLDAWDDLDIQDFMFAATNSGTIPVADLIWGMEVGLSIVPVRLRHLYAS